MSECVVRMEMPKNCEMCRFRVNDSTTNVPNWVCAVNQWPTFYCRKSQNHADEDKYLQDCPIICSLPEGHGRLIDADALRTDHFVTSTTTNTPLHRYVSMEQIEATPTIVPADTAERSET